MPCTRIPDLPSPCGAAGQNAVRHVRNGDRGRQADLDGADEVGFDIELPMFTVGRAGELANVHPQTLRQYDRLGLVVPQRTDGGARRYSLRDISRLAKAQQLSQEEGINLLASRGSFPWKRRTASCAGKSSDCAAGRFQRVRGRCGR